MEAGLAAQAGDARGAAQGVIEKAFTKPMKIALLSRKWVDLIHKPYEILYNYVWIDNKKAVKLLKHLDCRFDNEVVKRKNLDFVKFSRCKNKHLSL